jgi:hypothetical protein
MKSILTVLILTVSAPALACPVGYYDCGSGICCPG